MLHHLYLPVLAALLLLVVAASAAGELQASSSSASGTDAAAAAASAGGAEPSASPSSSWSWTEEAPQAGVEFSRDHSQQKKKTNNVTLQVDAAADNDDGVHLGQGATEHHHDPSEDDEVAAELCVDASGHFDLLNGRIDVSYRHLLVRVPRPESCEDDDDATSGQATRGNSAELFRRIVADNGESATVFVERSKYPLFDESGTRGDAEDERGEGAVPAVAEVVKLTVLQYHLDDEREGAVADDSSDSLLSARLCASIVETKLKAVVQDHLLSPPPPPLRNHRSSSGASSSTSIRGDGDDSGRGGEEEGEVHDKNELAMLEAKEEIRRHIKETIRPLSRPSLSSSPTAPPSSTCSPFVLRRKKRGNDSAFGTC